ncbi:hypothetical protein [Actinoplanes regularis]|uniref:Uncharacterized protein n=1 Tax=Actinoplanes regularis TaxID=52697 RepID=A0A238WRD9_9ACTN|nr:hypothetical protein [Actinoplanes regularis]GIE84582.1 hypothetical protein Are01nite_10620 [Actinoplanes regularis]SNR49075.1 hypothetical protein SAMN06264365_102830 [Actinoplanes regularis]
MTTTTSPGPGEPRAVGETTQVIRPVATDSFPVVVPGTVDPAADEKSKPYVPRHRQPVEPAAPAPGRWIITKFFGARFGGAR